MADHLRTTHLGHRHVPSLYDWNSNVAGMLHHVLPSSATVNRYSDMVLVYS